MRKIWVSALGVLVVASVASADLTVDANLGNLAGGSSTNLTGTTVGGNTNADLYPPTTFEESLGEYVYQFTVAVKSAMGITNNEGIFVGSDHDHFMLDNLGTTFDGTFEVVDNTLGFVDEEGFYSFALNPGTTYYLSVDTYAGSTEGPYDINIDLLNIPAAPGSTYLGVAGDDGDSIDMNSFGSDFDTEIGLYDADGFLVASNDDTGGLQSQIIESLGEGTYYLALGGYNTAFGGALFDASGGTSTGNYALSVTNTPGAAGALGDGEIAWFSFDITPEPASLLLLVLSGLFVTRRR